MKSTFYGQEDHKHAFSIKLKHFPTFSTYFIFCTLHFVHGWHNLKTAENSREKGSVDTTHISKALILTILECTSAILILPIIPNLT